MEEGLIAKLALGALVPGFTGLGVLGAVWWRQRRSTGELAQTTGASPAIERNGEPFWIMPALVASVSAVMIPILTEAKAFPPVAADEWLPLVAIVAGTLELTTSSSRFPRILRWTLRTIFFALAAAACARNMLQHSWSAATDTLWIAGFTALALAATAVLEAVLARTRGFTAPALLLIIVGGASQVLAIGYSSLKLGQSVGVAAAILGAACVVALLRPRFSLAFGGAFVPLAITASGVFAGDIAADTRIVLYTSCVAAAALLPGLILLAPLSQLRGWKRSVVLFSLAGLPMAAALATAAADELNRSEDEYESSALVQPLPNS